MSILLLKIKGKILKIDLNIIFIYQLYLYRRWMKKQHRSTLTFATLAKTQLAEKGVNHSNSITNNTKLSTFIGSLRT